MRKNRTHLSCSGKIPIERHKLMILVVTGSRIEEHCFKIKVGTGSRSLSRKLRQ